MKYLIVFQTIVSIFSVTNALSPFVLNQNTFSSRTLTKLQMSTVVAPPEEKTKTRIGGGKSGFFGGQDDDSLQNINPGEISKRNDAPLEYLEDEWSTRNPEDPFHILLLDTTFTKNERVTVSYVVGCLEYVLGMPSEEARELTEMAVMNGLSCLGTWEREECLSLGRQLQVRDLVVRVVPYCEGGMRGWQMRNADANAGAGAESGGVLGGSGFD
jgi:ATP-dependent Clp protease adapter protein ClpS